MTSGAVSTPKKINRILLARGLEPLGRWEAKNPKKGIQGDDSQRRDPDTGTGVPIGRTGERPVAEREGREGEWSSPGAERVCELGTASRSPQREGRWAEVCDLRSLKTCWLL